MTLTTLKSWLRTSGFRIIGALLCGIVILTYRAWNLRSGWVSASSREGRFEIEFPAKPEQQMVTGHMNDPRFQTGVFLFAQKGNTGYGVGWGDDFADIASNFNVGQRLDAARDGCLQTTQGTFVSEFNILKSGVPGRDMIFLVNGVRCRARIYISGARRYIVEVFADNGGNPDAMRFFESFHLLDR